MNRQVWPWSYLWLNTEAYYYFFRTPINSLSRKYAESAVKKIHARRKELEKAGIYLRKVASGSGEFKV